jgi:hypothetical protein
MDGIQRTGFDTVPATHAHVLKNHWWFKNAIDLFDYFMGASRCGCANSFFGIASLWVAPSVIHNCK